MKLVTNDYGCGTSSSILDYNIQDVVVVSEQNYQHVFEAEDDLLFIGHDFLFYLWDNEEKLKKWQSYATKHELWLWCFERIDAIVPHWMHKSHYSLNIASKFCKRILACDEDDCDKYGLDWLPQWASPNFFINRKKIPVSNKILFSGQAGGPEYAARNALLQQISNDRELSQKIEITNKKRDLQWSDYVNNLLRHKIILNPVGILKGLNTRAYEVLYSGRVLLQHTIGNYSRHEKLFETDDSIKFFNDFGQLKNLIESMPNNIEPINSNEFYAKHSLFSRMKQIGVEIK